MRDQNPANSDLSHRPRGFRYRIRTIRWISQLFFLVLFLFVATGTVCTVVIGEGIVLPEPFGLLQLILAGWMSNLGSASVPYVLIIGFLVFLGVVILLGRAFCAWACPLGTIIDAVDTALERARFRRYFARRTTHHRDFSRSGVLRDGMTRFAVLGAALTGSVLLKYPVWCAMCPIGILCRGIAVGAETVVGAELLILPAVGVTSLGDKRFWCRYICPVGALLIVLSRLNLFIRPRIRQDAQHRHCGACRVICSEGIDVCKERSFSRCTKCLDCYAKCPFDSVRIAWK